MSSKLRSWLSKKGCCQTKDDLWVAGLNLRVQLNRDELNEIISADVDRTIDKLTATLSGVGLAPTDLTGLYLVGASSRIPLIYSRVWAQLGIQPTTRSDPKAVVALGAATPSAAAPDAVAEPDTVDPAETAQAHRRWTRRKRTTDAIIPAARRPRPHCTRPHRPRPASRNDCGCDGPQRRDTDPGPFRAP